MDEDLDWKGTWPWGRKSPAKRIDDLRHRLEQAELRRRRLQEAYKDRMLEIDRLVESLEQDMAIAAKCEEDRCRRRVRVLSERIASIGASLPKGISERKPDQALVEELALIANGPGGVELELDDEGDAGAFVDLETMAGLARSAV